MARPKKIEGEKTSIDEILKHTELLIENYGAEKITIRLVIEKANISIGTFYYYFKNKDELLSQFIKSAVFPKDLKLSGNIIDDSIHIYSNLFLTYQKLGKKFMKGFYTPKNETLAYFLGQNENGFPKGSVMDLQEKVIAQYVKENKIANIDCHVLAADCCSIFKGVVFEWCLDTLKYDPIKTIKRLFENQLRSLEEK